MKPTPKQIRDEAINAATNLGWHVTDEGTDYVACVIAWHPDKSTNWCRVMTIADGEYTSETVICQPTVVGSGYVTEHLKDFNLNINNH